MVVFFSTTGVAGVVRASQAAKSSAMVAGRRRYFILVAADDLGRCGRGSGGVRGRFFRGGLGGGGSLWRLAPGQGRESDGRKAEGDGDFHGRVGMLRDLGDGGW